MHFNGNYSTSENKSSYCTLTQVIRIYPAISPSRDSRAWQSFAVVVRLADRILLIMWIEALLAEESSVMFARLISVFENPQRLTG
jgi:hypothetical protein